MYINEHPIGSEIEIKVKVLDDILNFGTEITGAGKKIKKNTGFRIDCTPVTMDGKKIRFGKNGIFLYVHNPETGRVYKYPVTATATAKGGNVQCFYSATNAKPENFRGAFRVPCNYDSTINIGGRGTVTGVTHDLSVSGAAYIFTANSTKAEENDTVSATIRDKNGKQYRARGKVIRVVENFNPGFTLIGVQFDKGVNINELVSKAQIEEIRKIRH